MNAADYTALARSPVARVAEARMHGALRGGFVMGDTFYTVTGGGFVSAPVSEVRDLRFAPYTYT